MRFHPIKNNLEYMPGCLFIVLQAKRNSNLQIKNTSPSGGELCTNTLHMLL